MGDTLDYMERQGDHLPAFCKALLVQDAPPEQELAIEISLPEYVPPADESP
jgi:hypothetical protein